MAFVRAARVHDVPPGRTAFVRLGGTPVLIVHTAGAFFALHGLCPHRDNPLEGATVLDHLVDCPWHHFQYDVRTGMNHYPRNVYPADMPQLEAQVRPLRTYAVEVRGQDVLVDLP